MIGSRYPPVTLAPLVVTVDVADLGRLSRTALEHGRLSCRTKRDLRDARFAQGHVRFPLGRVAWVRVELTQPAGNRDAN